MSTQYGSLREKIAAEKAERLARYAGFGELVERAHLAGVEAARAAVPAPMVVTTSAGEVIETVWDGPCGFAWIVIRDGRGSFGRWAAKQGIARKAYGGGLQVWCPLPTQSEARKRAYCEAYADTLRAAGVECFATSRLD